MNFTSKSKTAHHARSSSYLIPTASGIEKLSSPDRDRLTPQDAVFGYSPPKSARSSAEHGSISEQDGPPPVIHPSLYRSTRPRRNKDRGRSGDRKRPRSWKKLLWVKQDYPDNYTDEATFLAELKRNPRFRPYEFWPLMLDSTVIVQHVCSVVIFICCFIGIYQDRVSPVLIVGVGSIGTVLGWFMQDRWISQQESAALEVEDAKSLSQHSDERITGFPGGEEVPGSANSMMGLGLSTGTTPFRTSSLNGSVASLPSGWTSPFSPLHSPSVDAGRSPREGGFDYPPLPDAGITPRNQDRLATAKSAILIYCALLGLSPILKSLTRSTSSDSIWAGSCWLFAMNLFFFDYGSGPEAK